MKSMLSAHRKSFRIAPFFKRGRRVAGRGPAKSVREGTAHGIHRSVPGNPLFRHSKFFPCPRKGGCPSAEKVFGSTPFSKGVAGLQGGKPCKKYKKGARVQNEQEKQNKGCAIFDCTALFSLQEHRKNTQSSSLMLAFASAIIFWASLPGTSS